MTGAAREDSVDNAIVEQVDAFSKRLDLEDIQLTRWTGEILEALDIEPDGMSAELRGQYRFYEAVFQCRWNVDAPILTQGRPIASIAVTVVETFTVQDGPPPSPEVLSTFMTECALPIAMPYVREALQNMSAKLGIGPIVLGLTHCPGFLPDSAHLRRYYFHDAESQSELPMRLADGNGNLPAVTADNPTGRLQVGDGR